MATTESGEGAGRDERDLDALEEGWLTEKDLAELDAGARACQESRSALELARHAFRAWEIFLAARDAHARLEGARVAVRNSIRDELYRSDAPDSPKTLKAAEDAAREHPDYLNHVRLCLDAERVKDRAWGISEHARLLATVLTLPAAPKEATVRPLRSSTTTQQGAAERGGRDK